MPMPKPTSAGTLVEPDRSSTGKGSRTASSARSLLVTIFDLYLSVDDYMWTSAAIEALALFDISEKAARQAVWRLNSDGVFETERLGRVSRMRLTPQARQLHEERNVRSDRFRSVYYRSLLGEPRPPEWVLLLLSAERLSPDLKQRLHRELKS